MPKFSVGQRVRVVAAMDSEAVPFTGQVGTIVDCDEDRGTYFVDFGGDEIDMFGGEIEVIDDSE